MVVLSPVDIETALVRFESDTVLHFGPKHHLIAGHVIVHDIFQYRLEGLFADEIEPDFLIGGDLDSLVAAYIENQASHIVEFIVLFPRAVSCIFIHHNFEK